MLKTNPAPSLSALMSDEDLPFTIRLVTNETKEGMGVMVREKPVSGAKIREIPLGLQWPQDVFSLSHVALPFPESDSLYGGSPLESSPGIWLGKVEMRGERDVLKVSPADLLRLRWNPFYSYMEQRLIQFIFSTGA